MYNHNPTKVIYPIPACKLVGQGCLTYLAHILDGEVESPSIESIMWCQNLEKYSMPIFHSIPPYPIALIELTELNAQMQELR